MHQRKYHFLAYVLQLDQRNKNKTILRMLKNKETSTFHPPPWKESSDQQDLIIDKHRFQILDKSRAKERKKTQH